MDIRLLGSFEVLRGDDVITPSAPKPRRVLALLALRGNCLVRTDQIIEEVWEDRPPLSATTTMQTYIYQLRKLLHPGHPVSGQPDTPVGGGLTQLLRTCPGGYMLCLGREVLDTRRFEQLADRGRGELAAGDAVQGVQTLRTALELWRGPALDDIEVGPVLQAEVVRLEEARKSVLEQRIDAELNLGRHFELIGELTGLVTQEPTHEGFWGKLILALYRAGRRSEALLAYQRARQTLVGELGLDPSQQLRQLHDAVLDADPALTAPVPTPPVTSAAPRVPHQLPPDIAVLVGRHDEQLTVARTVQDPDRTAPKVAVVTGATGVGKSAFCVRTAFQLRSAHPDGVLYASLLDAHDIPVDPTDVLHRFLVALGCAADEVPATFDDRIAEFRSRTVDRRLLVVVDDVNRAEQLAPLLPAGADCTTLVASRRRLVHPAVSTTVELAPLTVAESLDLLAQDCVRVLPGNRVGAAARLVAACGGLPLVLRTVVHWLQMRPHWDLAMLVARMSREPRLLVDAGSDAGLTRSLRRTRRTLSAAADGAFERLLQSARTSTTVAEAAGRLGLDAPGAEAVLEELAELHLVRVALGDRPAVAFRYEIPRLTWLAGRQEHPVEMSLRPGFPDRHRSPAQVRACP